MSARSPRAFATVLSLLVAIAVVAGDFSAATRLALSRPGHRAHAAHVKHGTQWLDCFVMVDDASVTDSLRRLGVWVQGSTAGVVSARVPIETMGAVAATTGVRQVAVARHLTLTNDSVRRYTYVDAVQQGTAAGIGGAHKGAGVIVGIIDAGVDFNHINLCDAQGRSRVRAVYMPCDESGTSPVVDGCELPGSFYETPDEIAALTSDTNLSMHGTHTTGTAAGSYTGNNLHGMAPEADIAVCSMPENKLTDANIAHGLRYLFDYARRAGKPCVINMSIGDVDGPHDGSSPLCRLMDELAEPGRFCVLSAGNDGGLGMCLEHTFESPDEELRTVLRRNGSRFYKMHGYVGAWSTTGAVPHGVRMAIVDVNTGEQLYATPVITDLPADSVFHIDADTDAEFARYSNGSFDAVTAVEDNGMYHSLIVPDGDLSSYDYRMTLTYSNADQQHLRLFGCGLHFSDGDMEGYAVGNDAMSISDLACGDNTISVGAFCTRASVTMSNDQTFYFNDCVPHDIAWWSSYGVDARGISHPDLVAPGYAVISSANRYDDRVASGSKLLPPGVEVDGTNYAYEVMWGTSMSAPAVAGAVALCLEVDPTLDVAAMRRILTSTSRRDAWVEGGNSVQWGAGKLDATAAVQRVVALNTPADVNLDGQVTAVDIAAVVNVLAGLEPESTYDGRADVNRDGAVTATDIAFIINVIAAVGTDF